MARYNEILTGRYNRALQKLLSMKGTASLVQLEDTLAATIAFFWGRENRYLEQWNSFANIMSVGGAAANTSGVRIRNPAGSNIVAVLERINVFTTGGADNPILSYATPAAGDLPIAGTNTPSLDTRSQIAGATCIISGKNNDAVTSGSAVARGAYGTNVVYDFIFTDIQELPMLPNSFYQVTAQVVNNAIFVGFQWRERFLEDSERA